MLLSIVSIVFLRCVTSCALDGLGYLPLKTLCDLGRQRIAMDPYEFSKLTQFYAEKIRGTRQPVVTLGWRAPQPSSEAFDAGDLYLQPIRVQKD